MNSLQLGQLVLYILSQVDDLDGYTTTIRLVKFLYLIDIEFYRRNKKLLTGFRWIFHLFGPYATEIPEICRSIGYDLSVEEIDTKSKRGRLFKARNFTDFPRDLSPSTKVIVDLILYVWADQETSIILDYVYHKTEPMNETKRGEVLDFSKLKTGTRYFEFYIPPNKEMKERFHKELQTSGSVLNNVTNELSTKTDRAYFEGLSSILEENDKDESLNGKMLKFNNQNSSTYIEE